MTRDEKTVGLLYFLFSCLWLGFFHLTFEVARWEAVLVSGAALGLFLFQSQPSQYPRLILFLVVCVGTVIRFQLALAGYGNYDTTSWEIVAEIVSRGGNVYVETARYNTSPVWFTILGWLWPIHRELIIFPFHFMFCSFLTFVDFLTLGLILLIAKEEKQALVGPTLFFYLNPVSFLLTGYHGQFENLAILFLLFGIYAYLKLKHRPFLGRMLLWFFSTIGMITKHNIFYEVIIAVNQTVRSWGVRIILLVLSAALFIVSFAPYAGGGALSWIWERVFHYSSNEGTYGLTTWLKAPWLKYFFITGLFLFPFFLRRKDLIRNAVSGFLFFLTFTTGFGHQYLVLPVALAALRPTREFLIYSFVATLCLLGSWQNLSVSFLRWVPLNAAWVAVAFWFFRDLISRPEK